MISFIVAAARNGVVGKGGGLPWHLPGEMALFKERTLGHPIIMGRKTHESIGRALPGRTNIVITHQTDFKAGGCIVVDSLKTALTEAEKSAGSEEIFIIGGQSIWEQSFHLADRIYLTDVEADIEGDVYFKFNQSQWHEVSRDEHTADQYNKYNFNFLILERNKK